MKILASYTWQYLLGAANSEQDVRYIGRTARYKNNVLVDFKCREYREDFAVKTN